jgi:hypothetical protein
MSTPTQPVRSSTDWQKVAGLADVWELQRRHGALSLRAVAVALGNERVCVYSPVPRAGEAALEQLRAFGRPILFAPNAYHTLGLREHSAAFPEAPIVVSDRAFVRVKRKTQLSLQDLRLLAAWLPAHIALLEPPGVGNGEAWLSVRAADRCTWIVGDAFVNLPHLPSGVLGLVARALRVGPGLAISATFKYLAKDRRAYREWLLAQIAADRPTRLVPCHGEVLEDDRLPERLAALVRQRF